MFLHKLISYFLCLNQLQLSQTKKTVKFTQYHKTKYPDLTVVPHTQVTSSKRTFRFTRALQIATGLSRSNLGVSQNEIPGSNGRSGCIVTCSKRIFHFTRAFKIATIFISSVLGVSQNEKPGSNERSRYLINML